MPTFQGAIFDVDGVLVDSPREKAARSPHCGPRTWSRSRSTRTWWRWACWPAGVNADWDEWKALLQAAGVRDARLHDARHTAATLLLAQGVGQRVVMEILGHSQISMTTRYTYVLPEVMTEAAGRIDDTLWGRQSHQSRRHV
jgi:integrase